MSNEPRQPNYGEGTKNVSLNYGGVSRTVNATVNAPELQAGIRKQKAEVAKRVAEHQEYRRVKRGKSSKTAMLPPEEKVSKNGSISLVRPVTTTTRLEH